MAFPDCLLCWLAVGVGKGNGSFFAPALPATWKRPSFWYSWKSLVVSNTFNIFQFLAHFTALTWLQCEGIGAVLRLPRFYCEEQSLEGIICWLVVTSVVYCIHVKHTFEDYITQQTYVQQCNAQSAVLLNCGLHLELNFINLPFYLKASHQSGMLNRCWCMSRHICGAHCLSLKFRCFHKFWPINHQT